MLGVRFTSQESIGQALPSLDSKLIAADFKCDCTQIASTIHPTVSKVRLSYLVTGLGSKTEEGCCRTLG